MASSRILVVDDEPDVKELIGELLRTLGYEVETADSRAQALAAVGRSGFDLVVSDLHLADSSGAVLAAEIARDHPALAGRVILITGDPGAAPSTYPVIHKPFRLDQIARTIRAQLGA
jgi:DNA-binding NtrC family response regulator